ncbi:MAG: D-alanine--D-alanine ligase [Deltaproteobacteria bacterium]|nr:D-alanine--D-alanine ligase [Deltaproteobacteria bacterium]
MSERAAAAGTGPGSRLEIGLVYETFETYARRSGEPVDAHVEYEPLATVEALEAAVRRLGHRPVRLGSPFDLLESIGAGCLPRVDVALNIAEAFGSRNRESFAPALLEMAGVPYLGSDGLTLSLTLDKAWASERAAAAGLYVAPHCVLSSAAEAHAAALPAPFPLFVKPRWEGASKGIRASSRVEDREGLAREVARIASDYAQPALVEAFLDGAEYTVTVVGHAPARALPVLQRALDLDSRIGLHALEGPGDDAPAPREHCAPGALDTALEAELQRLGERAFALFDCRDFARADFRLDAEGRACFLEINPLPTFAPDGSFGILAELQGRSLDELLADVIGEALERPELAAHTQGGVGSGRSGSGPSRPSRPRERREWR